MSFSDHCSSTSLHGWQYLTRKGLPVKIYYALVVLLSISAAVYFVVINVREFRRSTVFTVLDSPTEPLAGKNYLNASI